MKRWTLTVRLAEELKKAVERKVKELNLPTGIYVKQLLEKDLCASSDANGRLEQVFFTEGATDSQPAPRVVAVSDGAQYPVYKLTFDLHENRWQLGPYGCRVSLIPVYEREDRTNVNAVSVCVYNHNGQQKDKCGKRLRQFVLNFDSNVHNGGSVTYATTYAEAVENLKNNGRQVEKMLKCSFDLSRLEAAKAISIEFARRYAGKVPGDQPLEF